jgi:hypothetical protein
MKLTRAILCGILLWVLIFFEVSILMFGFKLTGQMYYTTHYVLLLILTFIVAYVYFYKRKGTFTEGLLAGTVMLITGIILDAAITVPLFIKTYSFFADIYLWIGMIEGVIAMGIAGAIKK